MSHVSPLPGPLNLRDDGVTVESVNRLQELHARLKSHPMFSNPSQFDAVTYCELRIINTLLRDFPLPLMQKDFEDVRVQLINAAVAEYENATPVMMDEAAEQAWREIHQLLHQ